MGSFKVICFQQVEVSGEQRAGGRRQRAKGRGRRQKGKV